MKQSIGSVELASSSSSRSISRSSSDDSLSNSDSSSSEADKKVKANATTLCKNCAGKAGPPQPEQAPDYREIAARKNSVSIFNSYVELFDLMVDMEPELFEIAVRTLK